MFQVGDKIVHPMHGAGIIESIESRKVNGVVRDYYTIKLPERAMLVMIPVANCADIGVRAIVSADEAWSVMNTLAGLEVEITTNWNRRYRENMERLKSGDLTEVAKVIRGLMDREKQHGLSTGERKMLHSAKQILVSEVVLATGLDYADVEERIGKIL